MVKSDILFSGYYGQQNTGDDAFVEVSAWGAKNIWKKSMVRYLAVHHHLPKTVEKVSGYPLTIPKTYKIQENLLINSCDYLISAGGSTFSKEIQLNSTRSRGLVAKQKRGGNLKLGAIGVSIGPFKTLKDEQSIITYLKSIDFLRVRDRRSYDFVRSLKLPYLPIEAFDLAALLPDVYSNVRLREKTSIKKVIGISLCNYESYIQDGDLNNERRRNSYLSKLITHLNQTGNYFFQFFIINGHPLKGDSKITFETIERCKLVNNFSVASYNPNTSNVWEEISKCDFMLSTRLHAAIFACFLEIPFMLVEYHLKCSDFLEDIGYCMDYRLYDANVDLQIVIDNIIAILEDQSLYRMPSRTAEMKKLAYKNFESI